MITLASVIIVLNMEGMGRCRPLKTQSCHDAAFVVTGGITGSCYDNQWCHQWWQSWHYDNSQFSVSQKVSPKSCIVTDGNCEKKTGPWFNIKMSSYQYRKSHCGDKTILRPSHLHNGISYTGKMLSLYWIRALVVILCLIITKIKQPLACVVNSEHLNAVFAGSSFRTLLNLWPLILAHKPIGSGDNTNLL